MPRPGQAVVGRVVTVMMVMVTVADCGDRKAFPSYPSLPLLLTGLVVGDVTVTFVW